MGLENLPDLGDRFGSAFNGRTWPDVAFILAQKAPNIVEIAEFGIDGHYDIGYVLGKMKFEFSSHTETRVIYSHSRVLDEENVFSSLYGMEDEGFEYRVLIRKDTN